MEMKIDANPLSPQSSFNKLSVVTLNCIIAFLEFKDSMSFFLISKKTNEALNYHLSICETMDLMQYKRVTADNLGIILRISKSLRTLSTSYKHLEANKRLLNAINSSTCRIRSLTLTQVDISNYKYNFMIFCSYFKDTLTELSLTFVPTKDKLVDLGDIMNTYKDLKVFKYFFESTTLTEGWFNLIEIDFSQLKCKGIEHLELTNFYFGNLFNFPETVNKCHLYYNELANRAALYSFSMLMHYGIQHRSWKEFGFYLKHSKEHLLNPINAEVISRLVGRSKLEVLKFSVYCKNSTCNIKEVNDMNIMGLLETQKDLRVVRLDSFKSITEATALSLVNTSKKIKELSLDYSRVTDEVLYFIADSLKDTLQQLSIKGANVSSEEPLMYLVSRCTELLQLDLTCVYATRDNTLFTIYKYSKKINKIILVRNGITNFGLRSLLQTTSLRSIKVSNVKVNDYGILLSLVSLRKYKDNYLDDYVSFNNALKNHEEIEKFINDEKLYLSSEYDEGEWKRILEKIVNRFKGNTVLPIEHINIPYLTTLALNESHITKNSIEFLLKESKRLFKFGINRCSIFADALAHYLDLYGDHLGHCSASYISGNEIQKRKLEDVCNKKFIKLIK